MRGTNNLQKNIFLALLKIAQKFHYFCKIPACRISVKNSIFQKLPKNCGETLLLMRGTNNLPKNIFLALFKIAKKFHYFCKVRAIRISVKNSISKNCLKLWRNNTFDEGNKQFAKKYFLSTIEDSTKYSLFLLGGLSNFRQKFNFTKTA